MSTVQESTRIGHYRLLERIGGGDMSEVWRAHDARLDRDVALKLLPEEFLDSPYRRARFEQEARALAALAHPNIVTLHAVEESQSRHFLTMELVDGHSLEVILRNGALSLTRLLEIALPVTEALAAAHERGVVHGDLKPANLMVSRAGVVKIVDFGLARLRPLRETLDPGEMSTQELVPSELIAGTPAYMAPELLQGHEADPRADLFALGACLYEMATGEHPFSRNSMLETLAAVMRDEPPPPSTVRPGLPPRLDGIILRALHKDPLRRTRRALELHDSLQMVLYRASAPARRSVAVMPFANLSADPNQQYFCDGIAEEILAALSKVHGLRVASRVSSFALRDRGLDSREICDRLEVDTLLSGSLRKADDQLRINIELVDARDGCQLWTRSYERSLSDVFAIQEQIADGVVRELQVTLSPHERRALRQVATHDVRAYDYYLRGRRFYHQFRRQGMEFALRMYSRAIAVDPSYALAFAAIAQCRAFLYATFDRDERHALACEEAAHTSILLDPQLPEAHAASGVALSLAGRHAEAERAFETAIRLDPESFEAHYSWARQAFAQGESERAIELFERAMELMPDDYQSPLLVAQIYDDLRRPADAERARRRGVDAVRRRLDLYPDDVRALYMGANGLVGLGQVEEGLDWAAQARRIEPHEPMALYNLACVYSLAGEPDDALGCLEEAVAGGFAHRNWLEHDSNLDALHSAPRFSALLHRLPAAS